jgi:peptidoglycan/LPS O-acetylase OafA/YrhL
MTKFRYDINALRALAVTAVVGYHYNVDFLPGGFAGVDIFFVISGYLMTDIIVSRLQKDSFSVLKFYYDRAKRIVPGLLGLCFGLLAIGFFILDPIHYNTLSYTGISAILFYSNILFNESQGYFAAEYNTKMLLHTWSLSVEWQFYMIYPIVLLVLNKLALSRTHVTAFLCTIVAVSLTLCIYYSWHDQPTAFYLLPQRAWEMAAGGIVALNFQAREPKYSNVLLATGFVLIGVSVFYFNKSMNWPSYWAVAPVLGTCLVIAANQASAWPYRNRAVQTIGKWSYSIYLWHWPIAVMFVYFNYTRSSIGLVLSQLAVLAAIILSGALLLWGAKKLAGRVDWAAIAPQPAWRAGALAASFAITLCFALSVDITKGFANRTPEVAREVEIYKTVSVDWHFPPDCDGLSDAGDVRPCHLGATDGPETIILGDSFSMQIYQRLVVKKDLLGRFTFLTSSGCPPVTGIRYNRDVLRCNGFFEKAFAYAAQRNPARIVLLSNWFVYFNLANEKICFIEGDSCLTKLRNEKFFVPHVDGVFTSLGEILRKFTEHGTEVVIVSATPYGKWNVPAELLKRQFLGMDIQDVAFFDRGQFEKDSALVTRHLTAIASSIGATFFRPEDYLCDSHRCPTLDGAGVPYFKDLGHYSAAAVRTDRFGFFDAAVGINNQYSALPAP